MPGSRSREPQPQKAATMSAVEIAAARLHRSMGMNTIVIPTLTMGLRPGDKGSAIGSILAKFKRSPHDGRNHESDRAVG